LLPKSKTLQIFQAILLSSTIDERVTEDLAFRVRKIDCRLARTTATSFCVLGVLELPSVTALVMQQVRIVVTLVEKFENAGQYFGFSTDGSVTSTRFWVRA
jgi:hypothetical protein